MWGGCQSLIFFPWFFWGSTCRRDWTRPPSAYVWEVMEESLVDCPAKKKANWRPKTNHYGKVGPKKKQL